MNYRPITCLSTIYKTITSITSKQIQKYIDDRSLMPKEQKGYCQGSKGCKDQLLISKAVLQECKSRKKNKCMARIDYHKAFDSEPHSLIIKSLQLIGINKKIMSFTKKSTRYWQKSMHLHT